MKILIVLVLLAIIAAMGAAMYFMVHDTGPKKRTVNALILRISLSVGLIVFLVVCYFMGWIQPHGLQP